MNDEIMTALNGIIKRIDRIEKGIDTQKNNLYKLKFSTEPRKEF